jgi:hypothetical protein
LQRSFPLPDLSFKQEVLVRGQLAERLFRGIRRKSGEFYNFLVRLSLPYLWWRIRAAFF